MDLPTLSFKSGRRWGSEIEINAFDGVGRGQNDPPPDGIEHIGVLVRQITGDHTDVTGWGLNHNNEGWIVKPDASAGIEICTPVSKNHLDLKKLCKVVEGLDEDEKVQADNRCALHVHVDISKMSAEQRLKVLVYYIKCEPVFMDSVPSSRKVNRYCQLIGATDLVSHDSPIDYQWLIANLGKTKYTSLNTFHLARQQRETIEFRIAENEGCLNPFFVKNWVRFVVHFVERASEMPMPPKYERGNPWSSYCWLDPLDVMTVLGFDGKYNLSKGLKQIRNWYIARLNKNVSDGKLGLWNMGGRRIARQQIDQIVARLAKEEGETLDDYCLKPPKDMMEFSLYADEYIE